MNARGGGSRATVAKVIVAMVAAASFVLLPASPVQAATCGTKTGVSVVVDFHQLGGGAQSWCDTSGATKAASLFAAHVQVAYAGGGAVCRLNGLPGTAEESCSDTPPADAYWSLWWSDGTTGWQYASLGANVLRIPQGGSVAFSWTQGNAKVKPGIAPAVAATPTVAPTKAATQAPTKKPTEKSTKKPTKKSSTQPTTKQTGAPSTTPSVQGSHSAAVAPTATPTPSASAASTPKAVASATGPSAVPTTVVPEESGSAAPAEVAPTSAAAQSSDSGGVPVWALIVVVGVLAGASSIVAWRRKLRR